MTRRWRVVGLTALAVAFSQGVRTSFGVFVPTLEAEIGASRAWLGALAGLVFVLYGLAQPVVGGLADRFGAGRVITLGLLLVAAGTALASVAQTPIGFAAGWLFLATPGFAATATATAAAAVSGASAARGRALGLLAAAFPIGGLVVGPLTVLALPAFGWRATLGADAGIAALGLAPLLGLGLGLAAGKRAPRAVWSVRQIATAAADLWPIIIPYFVSGTASGFVIVHFVALAHDRAATTELIAVTVGLLAGPNIVGALASGWLTDRVPRGRLLAALYLCRAAAFTLLLADRTATVLIPFATLSALFDFANFAPAVSLAAERLRARLGTGAVAGALSLLYSFGAALGATGAGFVRESGGTYDGAVVASVAALVFSGLASLVLEWLPSSRRVPTSFL